MNVIRMIKFFGWEFRIANQVRERREDELRSIRKYMFLSLINDLLKYVRVYLTIFITLISCTATSFRS